VDIKWIGFMWLGYNMTSPVANLGFYCMLEATYLLPCLQGFLFPIIGISCAHCNESHRPTFIATTLDVSRQRRDFLPLRVAPYDTGTLAEEFRRFVLVVYDF
jgi:hypothetical protein